MSTDEEMDELLRTFSNSSHLQILFCASSSQLDVDLTGCAEYLLVYKMEHSAAIH